MYSLLKLLLLFIILAKVRGGLEDIDYEKYDYEKSDYEKNDYDKNGYEPYPWRPVSGPYGDRLKPVKVKDPKPDGNKFYGGYSKPYYPSSYIQGVYTYPYFGYGEIPLSPWYPPPYPAPSYGGYYIKKEEKDNYSPVYKN